MYRCRAVRVVFGRHCQLRRRRVTFPSMKIHEYQARQILAENGIPVPPAEVVRTPDEAAEAFKSFSRRCAS